MSRLVSRPGPAPVGLVMSGPVEAFVLRKKSFQGFKLEKTPKRKYLHFPFSGQRRKWWPASSPPAQEGGGGGPRLRAHSCKGSGLFRPRLFLRPAGGCRDRPCSPLRGLFSVLFLFCKSLGFLPCSLPEHTLHLASRGSCAGICEESALWCPLCAGWGCSPPALPSPRLGSMPALPCARPPSPSWCGAAGGLRVSLAPLP